MNVVEAGIADLRAALQDGRVTSRALSGPALTASPGMTAPGLPQRRPGPEPEAEAEARGLRCAARGRAASGRLTASIHGKASYKVRGLPATPDRPPSPTSSPPMDAFTIAGCARRGPCSSG